MSIVLLPLLHDEYKSNFNLTYTSGPVTHAHLRQFYNAFVLHRRFITDKLLKLPMLPKYIKNPLHDISEELNKNIACLYHVVSFGHLL